MQKLISFIIPITTNRDLIGLINSIYRCNIPISDIEIIVVHTIDINIPDIDMLHIKISDTTDADCINVGINHSTGKYIIPLLHQCVSNIKQIIYNATFDINIYTKSNKESQQITVDNYKSFFIYNESIIINRNCLNKLPFLFEGYYDNYWLKFMLTCLYHNINVQYVNDEFIEITDVLDYFDYNGLEVKCYNYNVGNNITCVIPFNNEGAEVEKTVQSIRATTSGAQIILINDASVDDYDYQRVVDIFNCKYIINTSSTGSGPAKQQGIDCCNTKYFILLDAHMRFYNNDWDVEIYNVLENNPKTILCLHTVVMNLNDEYKYLSNERGEKIITINGAYANLEETYNLFDSKWAPNAIDEQDLYGIVSVPVILGASYCTSKEYWNSIYGYLGLIGYGSEEPFISAKCWMSGGRCGIYHNIRVGHLYRSKFPYIVDTWKSCVNRIVIIHTLLDKPNLNKYMDILERKGGNVFKTALEFFNRNSNYLTPLINTIKRNFVHDFDYFLELNNKAK